MIDGQNSQINNDSNENGGNISKDNGELSKCQRERDEYLDGWKRAKAELINYKKDEAKRFEIAIKFANERLIRDLIIVLDSFDLALMSFDGGDEKIKKGVYLIKAQLEDALKQNGAERLVVNIGEQFDPLRHEVIAAVESSEAHGIILEEIEKGYQLSGKIIRPARVKVAK